MKEIFKQVLHSKPSVHIGKAGITDAVIEQIQTHFKKRKIIKIKFLALEDSEEMKEAVEYLQEKTKSKVLDIRGRTCVIMDRKKL